MAGKSTEALAGAVVLAAAVGFAAYGARVAGLGGGGGAPYPLTASFRSIEGVDVGTEVRLAGVRIGTVAGVALNPETYRADAVVSVRAGTRIPDDSAIVISPDGLLGGSFVEIVPGGSPTYLEAGDEITDTQGSVSLMSLLLRFASGDDGE